MSVVNHATGEATAKESAEGEGPHNATHLTVVYAFLSLLLQLLLANLLSRHHGAFAQRLARADQGFHLFETKVTYYEKKSGRGIPKVQEDSFT